MKCLYCESTESLGTEHLVPRKRGGLDIAENLFRACGSCNASKGDQLPSEWRDDLPAEVYEMEKIAVSLHPEISSRKRNVRVPKDSIIAVRCTLEQKELLESVAQRDGLGVSTWLLHTALRAMNGDR